MKFRLLHPKEDLVHIASQLAQFVDIVTNCFPNVEESQKRREVCSLLLTNLFSSHPRDIENSSEVSGLKEVSRLHRRGLESLADCVEPFHPGIDSSQSIPKSPLVIVDLSNLSHNFECVFQF